MPPVPRPNQCDLEIHRGVTTRDCAPWARERRARKAPAETGSLALAASSGLPLTMTRALGILA